MARVNSLEEMKHASEMAAAFTICGTLYSAVPYEKVRQVREKNRRLGIGLMGLHEWLLIRDKVYGPDNELERYLEVYAETTTAAANMFADSLSISRPVKTRAIAPTGTISILAETTSGIEPVFCTSFKRRYLKGNTWHAQYIVDATADRLIREKGVNPRSIEDAYDLAKDVNRRLDFQEWVQKFVDHGISSTINLPRWGSEYNNDNLVREFGESLMKRLPNLRGITAYPEGARGGQPLTPVDYDEAIRRRGVEYQEYGNENACVGGICGI